MRCDQCNKFVSYDEADPEVNILEISDDGTVTAEVRIVNTCAECGQDLKEATFDFSEEVNVSAHSGKGHELSVEEGSCERTQRSGYFKKGVFVPAGGRHAKTFYGVSLDYEVNCSCNSEFSITGTFADDVQASGMEELI
jgi:hypothetical protein